MMLARGRARNLATRLLSSPSSSSTRDTAEVSKFSAVDWARSPLRAINPVRTAYIGDRVDLEGLRVLDLGCGGGLLSASLAQRGALVTAVDANLGAIASARDLARDAGVEGKITFRHGLAEDLVDSGETFDAVCAMEIVEHVADRRLFTRLCAALAKPGGCLFMSTLDRTLMSWALSIVVAEHVLGLVPRGTHDWAKYVTPRELSLFLGEAGLHVRNVSTLHYLAGPGGFQRAWIGEEQGTMVNYILHATKLREPAA